MKAFVKRFVSFAAFIIIVIGVLTFFYCRRDVYMDFGHYKNYSWTYFFQSLGDLSTKKLLQSPVRYNSFILGSSRTTGLYACYLQQKIAGARVFHYGNWNESIGGIYAKLRLLDAEGYRLDNVVIYLDTDFSFDSSGVCTPYDHYLLTGENRYQYYYDHYLAFFSGFNSDKMKILLGKKVSGEIYPGWQSDLLTNDCNHTCSDSIVQTYGNINMDADFRMRIDSMSRAGFLYRRPDTVQYKAPQVSAGEAVMLTAIKELFKKHRTRYCVIVTPLYDQAKFNPADMALLQQAFGNHLFDFSGKNSFTDNRNNYPDRKHFLPYISKLMIDSVLLKSGQPLQ